MNNKFIHCSFKAEGSTLKAGLMIHVALSLCCGNTQKWKGRGCYKACTRPLISTDHVMLELSKKKFENLKMRFLGYGSKFPV